MAIIDHDQKRTKIVKLSTINQDITFQNSSLDCDHLIRSIRQVGLINPLILQAQPGGQFRIVSGFRRLSALKKLKIIEIHAFIIEESECVLTLFEFALHENLSLRQYNPIEVSRIINKLENSLNITKETIVKKYLPLLGHGRNPKVYNLYAPLIKLNQDWQQAIIDDRVSLEMASLMAFEPIPDSDNFLSIIATLRLGKNKQREFWQLLKDIARIKSLDIEQLINLKTVRDILDNEKITAAQKAERFKQILWEWRYPSYSNIQHHFETLLKEAKLPPDIHLRPTPYFEREDFHIAFSFKNDNEYSHNLKYLHSLLENGHINKMTKLT